MLQLLRKNNLLHFARRRHLRFKMRLLMGNARRAQNQNHRQRKHKETAVDAVGIDGERSGRPVKDCILETESGACEFRNHAHEENAELHVDGQARHNGGDQQNACFVITAPPAHNEQDRDDSRNQTEFRRDTEQDAD